MKSYVGRCVHAFAVVMTAWASTAAAQPKPEPPSGIVTKPTVEGSGASVSGSVSPTAGGAAVVPVPPPAPLPPVGAAPVTTPEAVPGTAATPAASKWYDKVKIEGFVDAYASVNYNFPRPQSPTNGFGGNTYRAYDVNNGFALHWVGLNASVAPEPVGGTVSLRFGPSATLHNSGDAGAGLINVKQAFASWKPVDKLTLDFGKYDQPFGSEVADTQYNMNYSRSALYWYAQPLYFTGLRLDYAASDQFDVKLFAVNGWNNSIDNNTGKSLGIQFMFKPVPEFIAYLGYLGGPEQAESTTTAATDGVPASNSQNTGANKRLKHIADVVLDINPNASFRALINADFVADTVLDGTGNDKSVKAYGGNIGLGYKASDNFSASIRAGYLLDPDGYLTANNVDSKIFDGTLTFTYSPTPNLLLRLDAIRFDKVTVDGNEDVFQKKTYGHASSQITSTLGIVATTN